MNGRPRAESTHARRSQSGNEILDDADRPRYQYGNGIDGGPARDAGGRIRIITESRLTAFWAEHPEAEAPLKIWRAIVRRKRYRTPNEVRADFGSADFQGNGVTVFNIGGNKYRLSVRMDYLTQRVYVRHVLTHDEYDDRSARGTL